MTWIFGPASFPRSIRDHAPPLVAAESVPDVASCQQWNGRRVKGLPVHTLVRGRFVMRERRLVPETRGWGRSVHTIQRMPPAQVRNAEQTSAAITAIT